MIDPETGYPLNDERDHDNAEWATCDKCGRSLTCLELFTGDLCPECEQEEECPLNNKPEPCEVCGLVDCRCTEDDKIAHYMPVRIVFEDFSDSDCPF